MRRVLVPLDGTTLGASIIPDARRLAGPDGKLVLIRDAGSSAHQRSGGPGIDVLSMDEAESYLENLAVGLSEDGVDVESYALAILDSAYAIDLAAEIYHADLVACATHGRSPFGRLVHGGVAWRALAHSTVPVLLRRIDGRPRYRSIFAEPRKIMVPLDGSELAETALPLAAELAEEWDARLVIVRVVPIPRQAATPFAIYEIPPNQHQADVREARTYLSGIAETMLGPVVTLVGGGSVVEDLVQCAKREKVTDIVMASHGRTGLSRVIMGSVADEFVHRLDLPIIVVPALGARELQAHQAMPAQYAQMVNSVR